MTINSNSKSAYDKSKTEKGTVDQAVDHTTCKWCNKKFKRNTLYKKHETKQICRPKSQRTYCESCDITFDSRAQYSKHLVTRSHIDSIVNKCTSNIKVESATSNTRNQDAQDLANIRIVVRDPMYMMDPYLTEKEAEDISMGRDPLASQYTLLRKPQKDTPNVDHDSNSKIECNTTMYKGNQGIKGSQDSQGMQGSQGIQGIQGSGDRDWKEEAREADRELYGNRMVLKDTDTLEETHNRIKEESKTHEEREIEYRTTQPTEYSKILEEMLNKPEPTDRQRRILEYLGRHQNEDTNIMTDKFKPVLAALKLPDADYLRRHILEADEGILSLKAKQIYVGYLDVFIDYIVGLSIEGNRTHLSEGVPFDRLVVNLTR